LFLCFWLVHIITYCSSIMNCSSIWTLKHYLPLSSCAYHFVHSSIVGNVFVRIILINLYFSPGTLIHLPSNVLLFESDVTTCISALAPEGPPYSSVIQPLKEHEPVCVCRHTPGSEKVGTRSLVVVYCVIIFIRWTFNFVFSLVGQSTIFKISPKYLFTFYCV